MFVGKNISYLRKIMNLTQDELAQKIIVSRQTISKWENGEVVPDSLNLIELSKLFNVKVDDLLMNDIESVRLNEISEVNEVEKADYKPKNKNLLTLIIVSLLFIFIIAIYMNRENLFPTKENNIDQEVIIDEIEEVVNVDYTKLLSAGRDFSVYIDSNGSLKGIGDNTYKQLNFENWSDIVQISAGGFHTLGLKSDGTVVATGYNNFKQIDVSSWSKIKQVSGGRYHSLGLKEDGTVLCVGENQYGACNVSSWTDIIQVSAGRYNSYGLTSDGTVVSTENNEYEQADVSSWADITQVSAGTYHVIGLKNDGSVVCVGGQKGDGACNISFWSDIKQVVGAGYHSIGLKNDGTVVAVGNNEKGQLDVSDWKDVVGISGGRYHTIGLTKDNTFLSLGLDDSKPSTSSSDNSETITDKPVNNNQTSGEIEYRNIGDIDTSTYLIGKSGNSTKNAKYDTLGFRFSFSSTKKNTLLKIRTIDGYEYVKRFYYNNVNDDSKGNYLYEEILKVMRVDYNSKVNQVLTFSIAEQIDDKDNEKGYTNWIDLSEKFTAKNDFDRLFKQWGSIEFRYNNEMFTIYPGRFDVSRYKTGADLDLSMGYDYAYMLYNNENYEYGGEKLYLGDLLSNNKNYLGWGTNFPDDFEVNKIFYACNSVHSLKEDSDSPVLISNCVPFSFETIKLGLSEFRSQMPYGIAKYSYAREWMKSKANGQFKINVEIPELGFDYDFEKTIEISEKHFEIDILNEIKEKVEITDSTPVEFKVFVKVIAKGVGNYLSSDPCEFTYALKKSDFTD